VRATLVTRCKLVLLTRGYPSDAALVPYGSWHPLFQCIRLFPMSLRSIVSVFVFYVRCFFVPQRLARQLETTTVPVDS